MRIGLSGKMCSGKSLVAQHLVKNYGFIELSFAQRLKELAEELFGVRTKDERGRLILQQLANHLREIDANVWLRYLVASIPRTGNVVVSDVRYPNEYQTLKSLGFKLIRMEQDRREQHRLIVENYQGLPLILLDDYSEVALDKYKFDYHIHNGTADSLEEVYEQANNIIKGLLWQM